MKKLEIFDPAMCCASGVCGPAIDPELMRMATVINGLEGKGVVVQRYGLSNTPQAFIANKIINDLLKQEGSEVLPVVLLDSKVVKTRAYPTNQELSAWLGIDL